MKGIDHLAGACVGGIMEQKRNQMGGRVRSGGDREVGSSRRQGSGDQGMGGRGMGTVSMDTACGNRSIGKEGVGVFGRSFVLGLWYGVTRHLDRMCF